MNAAKILSAVVGPVYINLHPECELSCSNNLRDKHGVVKLMMGHCAHSTVYQETSYLRLLALSILPAAQI